MMLVNSPIPETRVRLVTAMTLAIPFGLIVMFLVTLAVRARHQRVQSGSETFAGETAVAITELAPAGQVLFHGDVWNATATACVHTNGRVRIRAVHGLELEVEPVAGG
jgi:membrane-bound serine protease (ClpP class)